MVIVSLSRKDGSFDQLLHYMLREPDGELDVLFNTPILATSPADVIEAFEENFELLPCRSNGNALYHEILSLPPDVDMPRERQVEALRELAIRYLEERSELHLAVGVIHQDEPHLHMHLMISSNELGSKRRRSLKTAEFAAVKDKVWDFEARHYPSLHRQWNRSRDQAPRQTHREQSLTQRTGKRSQKQDVAEFVAACLQQAKSLNSFEQSLAQASYTLYTRGTSVGVQSSGGRRYRLRTLGLSELCAERLSEWELRASRRTFLEHGIPDKVERERGRVWER
jgi:hypothetical protein